MDTFAITLSNVWLQIASFLPRFLLAVVILIVGIVVAKVVSKMVEKLLSYTPIDSYMAKTDINERLSTEGKPFRLSALISGIVRWFFYLVTLLTVSDILQMRELTNFLVQIIYYLPNVLIAVIILAIGMIVARFAYRLIYNSLHWQRPGEESIINPRAGEILAYIARIAIIVFSVMAALLQLGIAPSLIQILFTGIVIMLSLAGGLAFGLGGKDRAHDIIERTGRHVGGRV